jgi:hypothetical protein
MGLDRDPLPCGSDQFSPEYDVLLLKVYGAQ